MRANRQPGLDYGPLVVAARYSHASNVSSGKSTANRRYMSPKVERDDTLRNRYSKSSFNLSQVGRDADPVVDDLAPQKSLSRSNLQSPHSSDSSSPEPVSLQISKHQT